MKHSGASNRKRQQGAQQRRQHEASTISRRLSLLSQEQRQEAQEILDLIYWGYLLDPDQEEAPEEISPTSKAQPKKQGISHANG